MHTGASCEPKASDLQRVLQASNSAADAAIRHAAEPAQHVAASANSAIPAAVQSAPHWPPSRRSKLLPWGQTAPGTATAAIPGAAQSAPRSPPSRLAPARCAVAASRGLGTQLDSVHGSRRRPVVGEGGGWLPAWILRLQPGRRYSTRLCARQPPTTCSGANASGVGEGSLVSTHSLHYWLCSQASHCTHSTAAAVPDF